MWGSSNAAVATPSMASIGDPIGLNPHRNPKLFNKFFTILEIPSASSNPIKSPLYPIEDHSGSFNSHHATMVTMFHGQLIAMI